LVITVPGKATLQRRFKKLGGAIARSLPKRDWLVAMAIEKFER